ncbi:DEAD/DEAH box helicase [Corynebacterium caspium]|uniref:DEAD/DEAH box helicase n=1 Tax=Corynebacterium caspium TaxID=234828 RepID=UPI00037F00B8|nr:DEAD/DEAH box helicase [Corynebacterium caspium]WKD59695.1 ATP-dependent RNA helicase RhlE [Corynebacterium caspium DSM 44850]
MSEEKRAPTFAELGVAVEITEALAAVGITSTFAIQKLTLPLALDGKDIIGQARTGTGKTLGFGVPLLDRVFDSADIPELDGTPRALVLAPTRELAQQVGEDLLKAAANLPLRLLNVYGGTPYEPQIAALKAGVDILIATPGRLLDLYKQKAIDLSQIAITVLDEADEMLDLGFLPDIEKILKALPPKEARQTMLFSATMAGPILTLARTFMNKPVRIRAEQTDSAATHAGTRQIVFQAHRMDKPNTVARILQSPGRGHTIIFTRTRRSATSVAEDLAERGFPVVAVHGDMNQQARERSLQAFRDGTINILVATDVAARGIDVDDVTHVINYQTPDDPATYVHRIGRTGRAGNTGIAVTLVGYDELAKWALINDELKLGQPNPEPWFSTSPELQAAFGFADDISNTVGTPKRVFGASSRVPVAHTRQRSRTTARTPLRTRATGLKPNRRGRGNVRGQGGRK